MTSIDTLMQEKVYRTSLFRLTPTVQSATPTIILAFSGKKNTKQLKFL
jgi:hypothetical protein